MSVKSEAAVLAALRTAVAKAGSVSAFASKAHVSAAYVRDVQKGHCPVGPKLLSALGFQRAIVPATGGVDIVPVDGGADGPR